MQHGNQFRAFFVLILFLVGFSFEVGFAEDLVLSEELEQTQIPRISKAVNFMDRAHLAVSKKVIGLANRFDLFFGDEFIEDEVGPTFVKLSSSVKVAEQLDLDTKFRASVRIPLPRLRHRMQLLIESMDNEDESVINDDSVEDRDLFTGLRYIFREDARIRLQTDGGIKFRPSPEPFARLRARKTIDLDPWAIRFTETLFWFSDKGFGETSRLDLDRKLSENALFRSTSSATWSEDSKGVDMFQSLSLFKSLNGHRALGFELSADGHTSPSTVVEKYSARVRIRRNIHDGWMFLEISPEAEFPRDRDYKFSPLMTFKLEVLFGDIYKG